MKHLTTQQLSASLDDALFGVSLELVRRHMSICASCTKRRDRMAKLDASFMRLFEYEPGEEFFEDAATQLETEIETEAARGPAQKNPGRNAPSFLPKLRLPTPRLTPFEPPDAAAGRAFPATPDSALDQLLEAIATPDAAREPAPASAPGGEIDEASEEFESFDFEPEVPAAEAPDTPESPAAPAELPPIAEAPIVEVFVSQRIAIEPTLPPAPPTAAIPPAVTPPAAPEPPLVLTSSAAHEPPPVSPEPPAVLTSPAARVPPTEPVPVAESMPAAESGPPAWVPQPVSPAATAAAEPSLPASAPPSPRPPLVMPSQAVSPAMNRIVVRPPAPPPPPPPPVWVQLSETPAEVELEVLGVAAAKQPVRVPRPPRPQPPQRPSPARPPANRFGGLLKMSLFAIGAIVLFALGAWFGPDAARELRNRIAKSASTEPAPEAARVPEPPPVVASEAATRVPVSDSALTPAPVEAPGAAIRPLETPRLAQELPPSPAPAPSVARVVEHHAPPPPPRIARPEPVVPKAQVFAPVPRETRPETRVPGTATTVTTSTVTLAQSPTRAPAPAPAQPSSPAPATSAPAKAAAQGEATDEEHWPLLCGEVLDESGMPVAGARVLLADLDLGARTDRRGRFCLSAPPGDRTVSVIAQGFTVWRDVVSLSASTQTMDLKVALKAAP